MVEVHFILLYLERKQASVWTWAAGSGLKKKLFEVQATIWEQINQIVCRISSAKNFQGTDISESILVSYESFIL